MNKTRFTRARSFLQIAASLILLLSLMLGLMAASPARNVAAPLGQTIWLRANANNLYVSADQNLANVQLVANRTVAQGWEMFTVVDAGSGFVALRASNGLYVSADTNLATYAPLVANRAVVQGWEQFTWTDVGAGQVTLRSNNTGKYVSADQNRNSYLVADRAIAQGWETFTWGTSGSPTPVPTTPPGGGNFPARFAAPYVETWNNTSVNNLANSTGNKFWTLAFMLGSGCSAAWNGTDPISNNLYVSDVNNLRNQGGDVIISFGGAAGTELGQACGTVSSLQAAYQSVITKYNLKWMDLDIEGAPIADTASIDRRNKALHNLQAANPGLRVAYTLAVDRSGLPSAQINLLNNAKANGVTVSVVNIMAMDYGPCYTDMGQAAVDAASATRNQLSANGISAKVGVTPMIGVNDTTCEVFSTSDAQVLVNYAQANSYISLLAYWAMGADGAHSYINIFKTFH
jgi:chitinase